MNPKPQDMLRAMGTIVHQRLGREVRAVAGADWTQCCVKVTSSPSDDYFKSHVNPPALKAGRFSVGER